MSKEIQHGERLRGLLSKGQVAGLRAKYCQQFTKQAESSGCVVPGCNYAVALMLDDARLKPLQMIPSVSRPGTERTPVTCVGVAQKAGMMRFEPATRSYHVTMRGEEWLMKLEGSGMLTLARQLDGQMRGVLAKQQTRRKRDE